MRVLSMVVAVVLALAGVNEIQIVNRSIERGQALIVTPPPRLGLHPHRERLGPILRWLALRLPVAQM